MVMVVLSRARQSTDYLSRNRRHRRANLWLKNSVSSGNMGGGSGMIGTPVAGTFTTPANSNPVSIDCTGYNYVVMSIQRTTSFSAIVFVDLTSNEVIINYNTSPTTYTITCTASNHIVSVAINGANTSRVQPYLKF